METIYRQGITLLPLNIPIQHSMNSSSSKISAFTNCDKHKQKTDIFCFSCNLRICIVCAQDIHAGHNFENVDIASNGFSTALRNAEREISERMKVIDSGIEKIQMAREAERRERKMLRRTVQSYYEGYGTDVRAMDRKIDAQQAKNIYLLLREELELGKYIQSLERLIKSCIINSRAVQE